MAARCMVGANYTICTVSCLKYSTEQSTSVYCHSKEGSLAHPECEETYFDPPIGYKGGSGSSRSHVKKPSRRSENHKDRETAPEGVLAL